MSVFSLHSTSKLAVVFRVATARYHLSSADRKRLGAYREASWGGGYVVVEPAWLARTTPQNGQLQGPLGEFSSKRHQVGVVHRSLRKEAAL